MDGSAAGSWTTGLLFTQSGSGSMINDTPPTDNGIALEMTCEQRQVEFGSPLPLSIDIANVLRYIQIVY